MINQNRENTFIQNDKKDTITHIPLGMKYEII